MGMGWTWDEDELLRRLVKELGEKQWSVVSQRMTLESSAGHSRNRKQCRERYMNHLHPSLSRKTWTAAENITLRKAYERYHTKDDMTPWAKIASELPGRSAVQVKTQWRRLLRQQMQPFMPASSQPSPWTRDDDKKLMELCLSTRTQPSWLWIASHFPARTDLQCRQHWTHVLDPALKKGKGSWTAEDDTLLGTLVERLGPCWTQIAQHFEGRIGKQCRERFQNHVDPSLNHAPWTSDEDKILLDAQQSQQHRNKWTWLASQLPGSGVSRQSVDRPT
ncbi:hypothetical protein H310_04543 [Aphanomyces invadans]|uniref:Uncharacterized protein n=1 Tax=Aphanomyces invadans TaxID=157072 RepID=A0A024UD57_9STRA|nr:hypothetical protein H310_04543 [Aphanomyces invadans]ETW04199.1 hypothetical protein H310_04543 [Aphanomyces invadans]|eukprot:XP_008867155.1 hypothetical protein H310_04543 [Aphanomyces invadans]